MGLAEVPVGFFPKVLCAYGRRREYGFTHGPHGESPLGKQVDPLLHEVDIFWYEVYPDGCALVLDGCQDSRACACEWVEERISRIGERQDESFDEFDRELARVGGFLRVVMFDVGDEPHVAWVFPERVP